MSNTQKFDSVQELLSDPARWARCQVAANKAGETVCANHPEAVRWCVLGAVEKVYGFEDLPKVKHIKGRLRAAVAEMFGCPRQVSDWNDDYSRTHEEVLALVTQLNI